jgi:hypothetical protein
MLARDSAVDALAYEPWLPASPSWDASILGPPDMHDALLEALPVGADLAAIAPTWRFSHVWLAALTERELETDSPTLAMLDDVLRCRLSDAESRLAANPTISTGSDIGVVATLLLARLLDDQELLERGTTIARLRSSGLELDPTEAEPTDPFEDRAEDLRLYEMTAPRLPPSEISLPSRDQAIAGWLADPAGAAGTNAPGSAVDGCGSP